MTQLHIDIETFCRLDLRSTTVYRYVEEEDFEVLMASWALDDDPVEVVFGDDILDIPGLWDPDVEKVAHNAQFERVCFSRMDYLYRDRLQWPTFIHPREYLDTMAIAAERGYPQSLDKLTKALGVEHKDSAGTALVNFFCKPNRKGERNRPEDYPEKWAAFIEYCRQDVVAMRAALKAMGGWPSPLERKVWEADQLINDRGIRVDLPMAKAGVKAVEMNQMLNELELANITGVANPNSVPQLLAWFNDNGLKSLKDMRADSVKRALTRLDGKEGEKVARFRRALELRQELALTSGDKYIAAMRDLSEDRRLRGQFRFFGAHTGRWSGRGVQLQNLTRADMSDYLPKEDIEARAGEGAGKAELEAAKEYLTNLLTEATILDLKLGDNLDSQRLKRLVRKMFLLDGVVVDYSAIEARCVAWEAGEEWVLEAFRRGRDIYVETATRMGQVLNREFSRYEGKVAVLALGYNGGVGSLRAMGGQGTDEELRMLVQAWRQANPRIVKLWEIMGNAFRYGGPVGDHMHFEVVGKDRYLWLPSGRAIVYHNVRINETFKYQDDDGIWHTKKADGFTDNQGMRTMTYGGRLTENATQAIARDLLAEALVRLEEEGYPVVAHVHDEVLVEDSRAIEDVKKLMTIQPEWAKGLPINGEGFTCYRYKKG